MFPWLLVAGLLDGILEHRAGGFRLLLEETTVSFRFHGISLVDSLKHGQNLSPEVPEELVSFPCAGSSLSLLGRGWLLIMALGVCSVFFTLDTLLFQFLSFSCVVPTDHLWTILFSLLGVAAHKTG